MLKREEVELLDTLKKYRIKIDKIMEGLLQGLHRSPFHGFSVDFKEYRPYEKGDDPRWIDWKLYARSDRFFVKKFEEETNVRIFISQDISNSMEFKGKHEIAGKLVALLTYIAYFAGDYVGLFQFDNKERLYVSPSRKPARIKRILDLALTTKPSGKTDFLRAFDLLSRKISKRSLIIIISDLMDEADKIINSLKYFKARHHELIVFHIISYEEIVLKYQGDIIGVDLETGRELPLTKESLSHLRTIINSHFIDIYEQFKKLGIRFERFFVEDSFEGQITRFLIRRR